MVPGAASSTWSAHHQQYDVLIFFTYLYAPTVLGIGDRAREEHPGPDRARRAGDPPGDLQGAVQHARGGRLQHRGRAPVPDDPLLDPRHRGRDGRLRRRPAAGQPVSARAAPARAAAPPTPATTEDDGRATRTMPSPTFRPHLAASRLGVPPPPPAPRPVPALRRAHRSRQGLRGADRVLQQLRAGRRRRVAGADGRQADAAARGAVRALRRPALGRERLLALEAATVVVVPVAVREPVAAGARVFAVGTPVLANARSEVLVDHCRKSNAGLYYADRDEFVRVPAAADRATIACAPRWAATAAPTSGELPLGRRSWASTRRCSRRLRRARGRRRQDRAGTGTGAIDRRRTSPAGFELPGSVRVSRGRRPPPLPLRH